MEELLVSAPQINCQYWNYFFLKEIEKSQEEIQLLLSSPTDADNKSADMIDQSPLNELQELRARQINRKRDYMVDCISARLRIQQGLFGVCLKCTNAKRIEEKKQLDENFKEGSGKNSEVLLKEKLLEVDNILVYIPEEELHASPLRLMCVSHQQKENCKN